MNCYQVERIAYALFNGVRVGGLWLYSCGFNRQLIVNRQAPLPLIHA
jgi:hypothetical protein